MDGRTSAPASVRGQGPESRDDRIYRQIVEAIVDHRLAPGARLREDALSEVFGVSRTGVRKALQRLALERLVTIRRHRGAEVARPSPSEARDVFAARRLVEGGSMRAVVQHFAASDRAALASLVERERRDRQAGRHRNAIQVSAAFHVRLIEVAGNGAVTDFVHQLTSRSSLIIAVHGSPQSVGCDCGEHGELLDLVASGEAERSRAWMERHLEQIEASLDFHASDARTPDLHEIFGTAAQARTADG